MKKSIIIRVLLIIFWLIASLICALFLSGLFEDITMAILNDDLGDRFQSLLAVLIINLLTTLPLSIYFIRRKKYFWLTILLGLAIFWFSFTFFARKGQCQFGEYQSGCWKGPCCCPVGSLCD